MSYPLFVLATCLTLALALALAGLIGMAVDRIRQLPIGTKSLLFGAHQFLLHPLFVARAWWRLYGFPWDPRLWVAFFVHDIGYWGCTDMDGPSGESHPVRGALLMASWFGEDWGLFVMTHSRSFAARCGEEPSCLCDADKLAFVLTPRWLYLPMARATGEVWHYMAIGGYTSWEEARWYADTTEALWNWVKTRQEDLPWAKMLNAK